MTLTLPNQYDFLGRFFRLALVNVLSNIMVPLASTLSVMFLGHLDEIHHLAGVALTGTLLSCLYAFFLFLRMGTTGVTAQAVGRDDQQEVLLVGLRNGLIGLVLGVALVLLQYPLQVLGFSLLDAATEVKASAIDCFNAQIWSAPAVLLNYVLLGWFLGREHNGKVLLLSFIGNAANIALDYLLIVRWDWASTGAGLSQAVSQYLMLLVGLVFLCLEIKWQEISAIAGKIWDTTAIKATLTLNGNIFIAHFVLFVAFLIFNYQSAALGTIIYAQNALLLQIVLLCNYGFEGLGFGVETLSGNFKGKGATEQLRPLIGIATSTSLLVGLTIAGVCMLFPRTVFGLLTNHTELIEHIDSYVPWLLSVLGWESIYCMLIGYFSGLAQGHTVRNASLIGTFFGFAPVATAASWFHSNHILWLALSLWLVTCVVVFGVQLPKTFTNDVGDDSVSVAAIEASRNFPLAIEETRQPEGVTRKQKA